MTADDREAWVTAWRRIRDLRRTGDVAGLLHELDHPIAIVSGGELLNTEATAIRALGKVGDARAVPALAARLRDPRLRTTAARALAKIDDASAIAALLDAVPDPAQVARRMRGFEWLPLRTFSHRLADRDPQEVFEEGVLGALLDLRAREAFPALLVLLRHPNRHLRTWGAKHAARYAHADAIPALEEARARAPLHQRHKFSSAIRAIKNASRGRRGRPRGRT